MQGTFGSVADAQQTGLGFRYRINEVPKRLTVAYSATKSPVCRIREL